MSPPSDRCGVGTGPLAASAFSLIHFSLTAVWLGLCPYLRVHLPSGVMQMLAARSLR